METRGEAAEAATPVIAVRGNDYRYDGSDQSRWRRCQWLITLSMSSRSGA